MNTNEKQNNKNIHRPKKKTHKFGGLIAVAVFCAGVFVVNSGIFNKKYELPKVRDAFPIIYTNNDTLNVYLKKSNTLSDYLLATNDKQAKPQVYTPDNGNGVFFLENYDNLTSVGSMFASYDGKTKLPVSSRAYKKIEVTSNGEYALFIETPNVGSNSGTLYIYKKNKDKVKLCDNVSIDNFNFSGDEKKVFYVELNQNSDVGDLYSHKINSEREKIDSNVSNIVYSTSKNSIYYTKNISDDKKELYYHIQNKASVSITSDISDDMVYESALSDNIFYCADDTSPTSSTLYHKTPKGKSNIIDTNVMTPVFYDSNYQNIIYTKNFSSTDFSYDTYIKLKGKDAMLLASSADTTAPVMTSYDFSTIAYMGDTNSENKLGNLYIRNYGVFKNSEPKLIAENISSFRLSLDGKSLAYIVDTQLYVYKNGNSILVSQDATDNNYIFTNNSKAIYYLSNYNSTKLSGNLFMKKVSSLNKEAIKIDSDVSRAFYPRSEKKVIYNKNYNNETGISELCLWKGKNKSELIDTGNINILFENK